MRAEDPDGDHSGLTPAEDIAAAIRWLCTDAAAEINGQRVALHG